MPRRGSTAITVVGSFDLQSQCKNDSGATGNFITRSKKEFVVFFRRFWKGLCKGLHKGLGKSPSCDECSHKDLRRC